MSQNRALVTGGTGFVGGHLINRLLKDGWQVHAITRPVYDDGLKEGLPKAVIQHSYDHSIKAMADIFQKAKPDVVFHLASLIINSHKFEDVEPLINSNVLLGCQILESMLAVKCKYMINTGTFWQHYGGAPYNPVNLYAATKQAFQDLIRSYTESTEIRCITLKLFDVYGPLDMRTKLFKLLDECSETGNELLLSPGDQIMDFIYIDDVIDAFAHAANLVRSDSLKSTDPSFAVSSGQKLTLKEVVRTYEKIAGKKLNVRWGGRPYRPREMMKSWDGPVLPGWKTRVSIEEGIRRMRNINAQNQKKAVQS